MAARRRSSTRCFPPLRFWKPPKHTHTELRTLTCNRSTPMRRLTCSIYSDQRRSPLFFSFFPLLYFCLLSSSLGPLSVSFSEPFAELHGGNEEKEREATAGSKRASGEWGAAISITVPFGNRDPCISNKTAKRRQIA